MEHAFLLVARRDCMKRTAELGRATWRFDEADTGSIYQLHMTKTKLTQQATAAMTARNSN